MIRTYVGLYLVFAYLTSGAQMEKTETIQQLRARGLMYNENKVGE